MATNPTLLTMPIAENGQKNTIPATQAAAGDGLLSQSTGFPPETALPLGAGGKAPTREDFNGALNLLSGIAYYAQKGFWFCFDATQDYFEGCVIRDSTNRKLYQAVQDVAAGGNIPSADDGTNWREFALGGVPLGSILIYPTDDDEPPYGFLWCEGQAVSRTMYPELFAKLGTKYGAGDGSTTFNLPNPLDKYPQFAQTAGTVKSAGLPNIEGKALLYSNPAGTAVCGWAGDGAFSGYPSANTHQVQNVTATSTDGMRALQFKASASNSIYGNSDTVTPPTMTFRAIIKAYDAPTPSSAQIDLSQYASDLANRLTREMTPAFNKRDVITTSGTYTAPVAGWYKITVKGGGGGGAGAYQSNTSWFVASAAGGSGGMTIGFEHLDAGDTVAITIGAGGAGGASGGNAGSNGGNTSAVVNGNTYTGGGGGGGLTTYAGQGGTGTIPGIAGEANALANNNAGAVHGRIGGEGNQDGYAARGGAGGNGGAVTSGGSVLADGKAGSAGYVWMEYFDPSLN